MMTGVKDTCIFIFRRDFRLYDNTTFIRMISNWPNVLPIFIFHPVQVDRQQNEYFSDHSVRFMIESLEDLNKQLDNKLITFHGDDIDILSSLMSSFSSRIGCVASNKDITPYAKKRDDKLSSWCRDHDIEYDTDEDYTLLPLGSIKNLQNKTYQVFAPFLEKIMASTHIPKPRKSKKQATKLTTFPLTNNSIYTLSLEDAYTRFCKLPRNGPKTVKGGRKHALKILQKIRQRNFSQYDETRNIPANDQGTTKLGAYIKFGCVSIREVYDRIATTDGYDSGLLRELCFREYYHNIAHFYPEILQKQVKKTAQNMLPLNKKDPIDWFDDKDLLKRWKNGQTGVPFVDAGMRCLNETGWLHNRMRMVCAMYLVKDLRIDWREGEKYFATKLVDYDAINNNQGWQWVMTYRRKFNPYAQNTKYDPECVFVKKWLPEYKDSTPQEILRRPKF
jgi:deoxyribodipyrimidine photo-lyase